MRGCAAAIARAVVAFLNAVLVGSFLSYFRPRPHPGSSCHDALGEAGEVLSDDDEQGFGRNGRSGEPLDDGGGFDEELRLESNTEDTSPFPLPNPLNIKKPNHTSSTLVAKPVNEGSVFVASDLNWDVENPTPRLPKKWDDGNCMPNTNTKYKEDKKVPWHDTPFEERLIKVLSDAEVRPAGERNMIEHMV